MHSLARPSHQRGMYFMGCPVPQGTKVLFRSFLRGSHRYHAGCPASQGNGISFMVYSSAFSSVSSSSSLDISDEPEEEPDEEDKSESVRRLVAFGWP